MFSVFDDFHSSLDDEFAFSSSSTLLRSMPEVCFEFKGRKQLKGKPVL